MAGLPFLTHMFFRNNGIDDTYAEELGELISNTRVTHLDLSNNEIGRVGNKSMCSSLKSINRIQWLEY